MPSVNGQPRLWRGPHVINLATHKPIRGYVTRDPRVCASCFEIIPPGSVVTLHAIRRTGQRGPGSNPPRPVCWHCQKFVLEEAPLILTAGA